LPADEEGFVALAEIMRLLRGLPNFRWATRADVLTAISVPRAPHFELREERLRLLTTPSEPSAVPIRTENCGTMEENENTSSISEAF